MPPVDANEVFQQFEKLRDFVVGEGIVETSVDSWHMARRSAKEKYARLFRSDRLKDLMAKEFESFLYFRNNRAWTGLYRQGKAMTADINALRRAIVYLQDETEDVRTRINSVLLSGRLHVAGLGKNMATAILHVCDDADKYGVWNNRTEGALSKLGRLPTRTYNNGEFYYQINEELNRLKRELGADLIMVDAFMWYVDKRAGSLPAKVRTTLVLERAVLEKLKQESRGNISELANRILKEVLFGKGRTMFGRLKGLVSAEGIVEEEAHDELCR